MDYTKLIESAKDAGLEEKDITFEDIEEFEANGSVARYALKCWQHVNANEAITEGWECTRVMACIADNAPDSRWTPATINAIEGLTMLHRTNGVSYYGKL